MNITNEHKIGQWNIDKVNVIYTLKLHYLLLHYYRIYNNVHLCEQLFSLMDSNMTPIISKLTDIHLNSVL